MVFQISTRAPLSHRFFLSVVVTLLYAAIARADHGDTADTIKLSIRTIHASDPSTGDSTKSSSERSVRVDNDIRDLASKLSQLPFENFQLISSKEEVVTLKNRDSLKLSNGHSLTFRPMYMDEKKVGLWLNWRDEQGDEILNTRVHFDASDSVLTGTDCSHDKGLILAIKAAPVER